jgi:hypothetical protein
MIESVAMKVIRVSRTNTSIHVYVDVLVPVCYKVCNHLVVFTLSVSSAAAVPAVAVVAEAVLSLLL